MPVFFLTIDMSSVYATDIPVLEVTVNGRVTDTISVDNAYAPTTIQVSYSGSRPTTFSFQFADSLSELGRSITINSVFVNGIDLGNSNLSALTLTQNDISTINIENTDYLYGRTQPTVAEMGTPTITGTNASERDTGTESADIMRGLNGNDKLIGLGGDDRLNGDDGHDHLIGGDGHDLLYGGRGNDRIEGGNGDDLIYGHNNNDVIWGNAGQDHINAGSGNDKVFGGADDDIILGWSGNDRLYGEAGNDRLEGGGGNDVIAGGDGEDDIYGSAGFDTLYGNDGDDYINGGSDNDKLYGGLGVDRLRGGNGDDTLYGEDGRDDVRGGNGNDWLHGGADRDNLRGEDGNDILVYDTEDRYWGGDGFDWVIMFRGDNSDIDFSNGNFRGGVEAISLENWNGASEQNNLSVEIADIIDNSDLSYIFVAGDAGRDSVTSNDFNIADRVAGGEVSRGGRTYAHIDGGATDIYIELGLDLNGTTIV